MSPDNVASSITLGNFTVRRPYWPKKSDMTDSSTMTFVADSDKIGSACSSHKVIYWPIALSPDKIA